MKTAFEKVQPGWGGVLEIAEQMDGQKECRKCLTIKPLGEFHRQGSGKDGRATWCKGCSRNYTRMRYKKIRAGTWDRWNHNKAGNGRSVPAATVSPSTTDLHWAAGFLEGEGSFTVYSSHTVAAKQKEVEPLLRLRAMFGGNIYKEVIKTGIIHTWAVSGARAIGVMLTMYTMLYSRRRNQVRRALGALNLSDGGGT
ncbi:MAG: hypothetical protein NUW01_05100 [Gemmatimonadaceae bacterium]|nr:hypothetical protein [Gemmatimonadaceae bacterium]